MLPSSLVTAVGEALRCAGVRSPMMRIEPLKGGFTSKAGRIITRGSTYVLKWHMDAVDDLFVAEARGLALLRQVGGLHVPEVLAAEAATGDRPGFMIQECVESQPALWRQRLGKRLGEQIASMHLMSGAGRPVSGYGLDYDNYFGTMAQSNGWDDNWPRFFRDRRLRPQIELADQKDLLPPARRDGLERLLERVEALLAGVERRPALLHGDLWAGNVLCDGSGAPVLIDPCPYYGDREAELAYTELWGNFPLSFYQAYEQVWPTAPGRADRRDLYNLYHHLGALNSRGETFGGRVDAVVHWYVGA